MKTSVLTLLKLELRARFGSSSAIGKKEHIKRFASVMFSIVMYAVFIAVLYFLSDIFIKQSKLTFEFLVLGTFVAQILMTIVCTGALVKNLYFSGDNELLLRFPVSGTEVLIAKSLIVLAQNFLTAFLVLFPFYVIFGALANLSVGYYFLALFMIIPMGCLPYFVANLISIPVMMLVNFVKNRYGIILIISIALLCGGFIFYMQLLSDVLIYIRNNKITLFSPQVIENLKAFANNAYPFRWYADVLSSTAGIISSGQTALRFLYIFLITLALGVAAYFTTSRTYYKTILYGIETGKAALTRKTAVKTHSQSYALFRREFLLIFRSFNYSFQYFAMAVAAPVMVYYCNDLAAGYGQSIIGMRIAPGLTLMVITLFVTIIVSFASTTVSREGNCFYHTKIIPVSYRKQVLIKLLLYSVVATASNLISCLVVGLTFGKLGRGVIEFADMALIFLIAEMLVVSLTCMSIRVDIKKPTFNVSGDGELVAPNKNVSLTIFIGVAVAVLMGFFVMLFSILPLPGFTSKYGVYVIPLCAAALLLIVTTATLFPTLSKDYRNITP